MSRPPYGLLLRSNFRKIRMCITYGVSKANFFTNAWIGKWDFFHNIWQRKSILGKEKNTYIAEISPFYVFFVGQFFSGKLEIMSRPFMRTIWQYFITRRNYHLMEVHIIIVPQQPTIPFSSHSQQLAKKVDDEPRFFWLYERVCMKKSSTWRNFLRRFPKWYANEISQLSTSHPF